MQASHGYLVIAIITILFLVYGSTNSGMWNGPDYYNPQLEGVLGGPFEPGLRPANKAYTMGGLPNPYAGLAPNGAFLGKYDHLGMNLTGRNAFPGDFDYSMYHKNDCGCGCNGRNAAKQEATELAAKASTFISHMTHGYGVGNKYSDVLNSSVDTASGRTGQYKTKCMVGGTIKNPQSCPIEAADMSYDAGGNVSQFTSGNTDVRLLEQTSALGNPTDLSMIPRSSQWPQSLFGRTVNAGNISGGSAIMAAYMRDQGQLEDLQGAYLTSANKNSEINGGGRINPHIDSPINNGINYGKKGKVDGFRGKDIMDETKGALLRF